MNRKETAKNHAKEPEPQPHRVRLPGFLIDEEIGLGDAIKRVTYAMGIKPAAAARSAPRRSIVGCISHDSLILWTS